MKNACVDAQCLDLVFAIFISHFVDKYTVVKYFLFVTSNSTFVIDKNSIKIRVILLNDVRRKEIANI